MNYNLLSQSHINTYSDYYLFNDDERVLYKNVSGDTLASADIMVWVTYNIPFPELCVLFSVYPLYPAGVLNSSLRLDIFLNSTTLTNGFTKYADFCINTATM